MVTHKILIPLLILVACNDGQDPTSPQPSPTENVEDPTFTASATQTQVHITGSPSPSSTQQDTSTSSERPSPTLGSSTANPSPTPGPTPTHPRMSPTHSTAWPSATPSASQSQGSDTESPSTSTQSTFTDPSASPTQGTASASASPPATQSPVAITSTPRNSPTPDKEPSPTYASSDGVPQCQITSGDKGGFRFSTDQGQSLAVNSSTLSGIAYTWAVSVDPRDPNVILQLHDSVLYRSEDAGCTFSRATLRTLNFYQMERAPGNPDFIALTSFYDPIIAISEDGGTTWDEYSTPTIVYDLAISETDPWQWTLAGQGSALWFKENQESKWQERPIPYPGGASTSTGAHADNVPGRWLVSSYDDLMKSEDNGLTWTLANGGLPTEIGDPAEPVVTRISSHISFAPSNGDIVYMVLNSAGINNGQRAIWQSRDGGESWQKKVTDDQLLGELIVNVTGGTKIFINPSDADHAYFAFGTAVSGYGTDLFWSFDGLSELNTAHYYNFHDLFAFAFGPFGSQTIFLGVSSEASD